MEYEEIKHNLFSMDSSYTLAHCISSDCAMGAGIAVEFQKRFGLKGVLLVKYDNGRRKHPTCIYEKGVMNLITKKYYYNKPTNESMYGSLLEMKRLIVSNNIKKLAMPKIGAGLDRLSWGNVRDMILDVFKDVDIKIVVCSL